MHFMFFTLKRAHLRALANARSFNRKVEPLTPARYDALHAIEKYGVFTKVDGDEEHLKLALTQKRLWRALGIARISVSKMVRRLMALGLLDRRRDTRDRRTFAIFLTPRGEQLARRTDRLLRKRRPFARRFTRTFGVLERASYRAVDKLDATIRTLSRHLGDTAWKLYPNGPPQGASAGRKPFVRARRAPPPSPAAATAPCTRTRATSFRPLKRCGPRARAIIGARDEPRMRHAVDAIDP